MREVLANENFLENFLFNLRCEDKSEIIALNHNNFKEELFEICLNNQFETYFLASDINLPLAIGGVYQIDNNIGRVWLLCTTFVNDEKKAVFKYVKNKIEMFKNKYDILFNFIYKSNFSALKWLKACGFKVLELKNSDFKLFYFTRKDVEFDIRYFAGQ